MVGTRRSVEAPSSGASATAPAPGELDVIVQGMSRDDLRAVHGRALDRLHRDFSSIESPEVWTSLALRWLEEASAYIASTKLPRSEHASLPEWRYLTDSAQRTEGDKLDQAAEVAVLRFQAVWAICGLDVPGEPDNDGVTRPLRAERALLELISTFTRRVGLDVTAALQAHARDVVEVIRGHRPASEESHCAPPERDTTAAYAALFVDRMREHRERVLASGHRDREVIVRLLADDTLADLAQLVAAKMALSWEDGTPHSMLFADEDAAWVVMTFRGSVADAADWYARELGGYTRMLDGYLASDQIRGPAPESLVHMSFGFDGQSAWVNVTLLAVEGPAFRDIPILATDLMSQDELAAASEVKPGE